MADITTLPVADLLPSKTNPRAAADFAPAAIADLLASVKEKGVQQPLLVRKAGKKWEVITGHRRLHVAKEAKLKEVPVRVVSMSDTEAREAQIIENMQRADVHPLEEGAAYRALIEGSKPRYEVADVAAKMGKSESYVRDRLLLTNLIPAAQKAFRAGTIHAGHAALIARLDAATQKKALDFCEPGWSRDDSGRTGPTDRSTRELREHIQELSWQDIARQPWANDDALKAAYAGCEECKGKGGDLFGKKAAEACTNPKCYIQRALAYVELKRKEEPGLALISGEYGKVEPYGPNKEVVRSKSEYEEVQGKPKKCTTAVRAIIVSGDGIGHVKTVCWEGTCPEHGSKYRTSYNQTPAEKARARALRKKELAAARAKQAKHDKEISALAKGLTWPLPDTAAEGLLELALHKCGGDTDKIIGRKLELEPVLKKLSWSDRLQKDWSETLRQHGAKLDATGKVQLAFELFFEALYSGDGRRAKIHALMTGKRAAKKKPRAKKA